MTSDPPTAHPLRTWPAVLAAGVLSAVGALVALAPAQVEPFGHRSVMVIDLYSQYAPYMAYLHHVFTGHGSVLLAWPAALGTNFLALFTYYLASPLTLAVSLVPTRDIPQAVEVVTILKIALAGMCMARFLLSLAPQRRVLAVAFASAYALMAYNIVYSLNIMWLDATFLLPLICLAVDRMLAGRGAFPLGLVLAYTWLTSFYTGYPATVCGGCYLLARLLMRHGGVRTRRQVALPVATYAATTLLGIATAAVLLVPTAKALRLRAPQPSVSHGLWPLRPGPLTLVAQHVTGAFDSLHNDGSPNVTVGFAVVVMAVLFFTSPAVARRTRVAWGAFLAFLALSLCVPVLTWAWQGFGEAHWYPYRFSFVYSFVLVTIGFLGADAVLRPADRDLRRPVVAGVIAAALLAGSAAYGAHVAGAALLLDAGLCVLVTGFVVAQRRRVPASGAAVALVLAVVVAGDAMASAAVTMSAKAEQSPYQPMSAWTGVTAYTTPAVGAAAVAGDAGRVAFAAPVNRDDTLLFGVPGVDLYATFVNGREFALLHALGLALQPGSRNWISTRGASPLADAALGIRALVDNGAVPPSAAQQVQQMPVGAGSVTVDRVLTGGAVGYVAAPTVLGIGAPGYGSGADLFALAERLLGAAPGSLESPSTVRSVGLSNVTARPVGAGVGYRLVDPRRNGVVTWHLRLAGPGELYAHIGTETLGRLHVRAGAGSYAYPSVEDNGVLALGARPRDVDVSLVLAQNHQVVIDGAQFPTIDVARVARYVGALPKLDDVHRGARSLSGNVDSRGGVLVVSVPYDGGWTATVDGHRERVRRVAGAFLGVSLSPGRHRVRLSYQPPGIGLGLLVSCLGALGLVVLAGTERRRRSQR